ncbi:hypothetical protein [Encephalitozoon cuniculi GB-M1]|uniref:Uncharacterized protein n=2 Tax=Encephalitozoon cuniculi TaxID=6035 RepID=Q8SU03_ENCCU|nr:uncharacterized protein ECU11_1840 [Encephalitozoon cuniculi GB-M1]AGE94953.1 hypothetical protein ECU11_1840 [Encephalitozoon cuniculi]UYI26393.1 hypothetical protein J0A71_01g02130 [Encephalitozoon cuniculi]CAD26094.1 hypothetical protein [Encephalitozoon cuniculi GB-M1]
MLFNGVFLMLSSVLAIAEYYNQNIIPYIDGIGSGEAYSEYNTESSMISMSESNALEGESRPNNFIRETAVAGKDEEEGFPILTSDNPGSPAGAIKSLRIGKFKINPENISDIIHREMADMSPDLHSKIENTLARNSVDRRRYRDLFLIKKRVIDDGRRKIINFNIKEKIIPKEDQETLPVTKDFGTRALLGGIMFLLAGLVFTTTLKMYQNLMRKNYLGFDEKGEMFTEPKQSSQ